MDSTWKDLLWGGRSDNRKIANNPESDGWSVGRSAKHDKFKIQIQNTQMLALLNKKRNIEMFCDNFAKALMSRL